VTVGVAGFTVTAPGQMARLDTLAAVPLAAVPLAAAPRRASLGERRERRDEVAMAYSEEPLKKAS